MAVRRGVIRDVVLREVCLDLACVVEGSGRVSCGAHTRAPVKWTWTFPCVSWRCASTSNGGVPDARDDGRLSVTLVHGPAARYRNQVGVRSRCANAASVPSSKRLMRAETREAMSADSISRASAMRLLPTHLRSGEGRATGSQVPLLRLTLPRPPTCPDHFPRHPRGCCGATIFLQFFNFFGIGPM